MDIAELQRAVDEAKKHCIPRAIVVINPGNPTGVYNILACFCLKTLYCSKEFVVSVRTKLLAVDGYIWRVN
jgi:hypothetical protein